MPRENVSVTEERQKVVRHIKFWITQRTARAGVRLSKAEIVTSRGDRAADIERARSLRARRDGTRRKSGTAALGRLRVKLLGYFARLG